MFKKRRDLHLTKIKKRSLKNQTPLINCFAKIIYPNKILRSYFWYCASVS